MDTIVAAATPPGRGGIGIVRLSGPAVPAIARALLGALPEPRYARLGGFADADGRSIDEGLALYFPAPHSYTGEDVLELHGHGGPVLIEALICRALTLGARRAQPGEFTQRAYLNDKLDLAQAEAVADLIDAGSAAAARAALRSLQGEFSAAVQALDEELSALRAHVEATIDFPTDEIDFLGEPALRDRLAAVRARCAALERGAQQGRVLTEGLNVVIAGAPNAGKSTLLNRLAGIEAAIVTPEPGTTRDVLRERVQIEGVPLLLHDTAGLRPSTDPIELEGMRRARGALQRSDLCLYVIDVTADAPAAGLAAECGALGERARLFAVLNKLDRLDGEAGEREARLATCRAAVASQVPAALASTVQVVAVSAATGAGIDELKHQLLAAVGYEPTEGGLCSARGRHLEALARTSGCLAAAEREAQAGRGELVAEELASAQRALAEITGAHGTDELLGRIFASFCIGK